MLIALTLKTTSQIFMKNYLELNFNSDQKILLSLNITII
ncbi:hypothetical protein BN1088_1432800 [Sphingobacterium sp. PM2-P1-29]|nr:hypothetical protein BN1088_1432800 [Sphingobacterium sp. PM2-P1-29]